MNKLIGSKTRKKAQIEMIGLIIIVIIFIIGIMIFTIYKLNFSHKNQQTKYLNKEVATNLLIAMMKTNVVECQGLELAELIKDCTKEYHMITCDAYTSCELANSTIYTILNSTLIDWGVSFNFTIQGTNVTFINLNCDSTARNVEQAEEILPLNPGQADITLDLCTW